tara:strand:- start:4854 stop:5435 length:582 start_codon:yes stop_codon:yes gene_type:complete
MWRADTLMVELKYRNHDYNSKDGMQSAIFGPPYWMTIHMASFNYPVEPTDTHKQHYLNWLLSFEHVLPCRYCRENFPKNLEASGFDFNTIPLWKNKCMKSRHEFSLFCYTLHDSVNKMLKKTSPTFEEIRNRYENFRAKCLSDDEKIKLQQTKKELGCIRPSHNGERGKCVISIIPQKINSDGFIVHKSCKPS